MRIITIEEHFKTRAIWDANRDGDFIRALAGRHGAQHEALERRLDDLGSERIAAMDAAGIDLQVVSHTTPATETLDPGTAVELAREANDQLADAVAQHPDRLAGFATLPTPEPEAAAAELERAVQALGFRGALVNGTTQGRFLDDQFFWPIFAAAERLGVPVYLHPTQPPAPVRQAYFSGFSEAINFALASGAWGWHVETGLHALRLILSGVFDRHPGLQIVIGHMGEAVPFMLARADSFLTPMAGLRHSVHDYFAEHFSVTTSGMFTPAPLLSLLLVLGADRVLFSVDYPYSPNDAGRAFLDSAPISAADREKIAHGNAERLLGV